MFVDCRHEGRGMFVNEGSFGRVIFSRAAEAVIHVGYGFAHAVYPFLGEASSISKGGVKEGGPMGVEKGGSARMTHKAAQGTCIARAIGRNVNAM